MAFVEVFEGYGLSETSGAGTVTADGDLAPGTVGAVLSCNELRLKDVPDMGRSLSLES